MKLLISKKCNGSGDENDVIIYFQDILICEIKRNYNTCTSMISYSLNFIPACKESGISTILVKHFFYENQWVNFR